MVRTRSILKGNICADPQSVRDSAIRSANARPSGEIPVLWAGPEEEGFAWSLTVGLFVDGPEFAVEKVAIGALSDDFSSPAELPASPAVVFRRLVLFFDILGSVERTKPNSMKNQRVDS